MSSPLKVGSLNLNSRVFQSPLAGVTDRIFRKLVRRNSPNSMIYTEMINATELCHLKKVQQLVDIEQKPIGVQIFDSRYDFIVEAAKKIESQGAQIIDINMGCPVNKITKKGGGSSLLKQPKVAQKIIYEITRIVKIPITVKTRIGWNGSGIDILDFAKMMEDAGAAMLTIHARTRDQGYNGTSHWKWVKKIKENLLIPIIANGNIFSIEDAVKCLEITNADGVMCSRGTLGYPFLVGEIDYFFQTGYCSQIITPYQRLKCAKEHLKELWKYKGNQGIYQGRKHLRWYCQGFPGASELRKKIICIESIEEGYRLLDKGIELCT